MPIDRRYLLTSSLASAALAVRPALATAIPVAGIPADEFGVRADSHDDQSAALQRAIDAAAQRNVPLWLAPGNYRAGGLRLPNGSQLAGARGATRIVSTGAQPLLASTHSESISLSGVVLDGAGIPLAKGGGVVQFLDVHKLIMRDCAIVKAGGNGIALERCDGEVTRTRITGADDNALFCRDGRGMQIVGNNIRDSGNGGIRVWQAEKRPDGSVIADNVIDDTHARDGGTGQNGNAINVFRAANVMVRGNRIRNAAFSAIRGNSASHIQIIANDCTACDEVAIYSEFDFESAVIAENVIEDAANGISVTNFKEGGRLASVHGNILRNLRARGTDATADAFGIGIAVEADTIVNGNVVENAQNAGISAGWGPYLRNVAVTANVLHQCGIGVTVSVAPGAGNALIANNLIVGASRGAIRGMEWQKTVTGDLARGGGDRFPQLNISGNQVS